MSPAVLHQAQRLLKDEVRRRAHAAEPGRAANAVFLQASPVAWLLPRLLELVMIHADRPIEALRPTIRQLLLEQTYANVGGDCTDCQALHESLDDAVELMLGVLRSARQHARQTTPTMQWV